MKTCSMNSEADLNEQDILLIHWYIAPEACGAQCLLSMFRMHNFKQTKEETPNKVCTWTILL